MNRSILTIMLITLLTLPLKGCLLAGAALGAGSGYYASKEIDKSNGKRDRAIEKRARREERAQQQQQQQSMSTKDTQLAGQLATRLLGGGLTNILSVQSMVQNGVVTLFGNVPSPKIAQRAIETARRLPGVKSVISNLVVVEYTIVPAIPKGAMAQQLQSQRFAPPPVVVPTPQPRPAVAFTPQDTGRQLKPREEQPETGVSYMVPQTTAIKPLNPQDEVLPWQLPDLPKAERPRTKIHIIQ
jgi:hypothetical protein